MPRNTYTHYLEHTLQKTEEDWLANPELHTAQAKAVKAVLFDHPEIKTMVEVGCATGNLAKFIPSDIKYLGLDASHNALEIARKKNPAKIFLCGNILLDCPGEFGTVKKDLVVCFATMKHFCVDVWEEALQRVLSFGTRGLFDIPIAEYCKDDGVDFPHVWVTEKYLRDVLKRLEYDIVSIDKGPIEWIVEVSRADF